VDGEFRDYIHWVGWPYGILSPSAFMSAKRAGVFDMKPLGRRGGWWYAVRSVEAWSEWASVYRERSRRIRSAQAARMLGARSKRG
jgi:hypothetical protein